MGRNDDNIKEDDDEGLLKVFPMLGPDNHDPLFGRSIIGEDSP